MKKSEIALKQNQLLVEKEVYDYWEAYQYQRDVVAMEKKNIELAELNLKRSSEAFKLGQITSIEYRQAQLNLLASNNRLSKAKYDGTKAAYQLLRLQGSLVIDQ
jgi:outer membrane protein TolC